MLQHTYITHSCDHRYSPSGTYVSADCESIREYLDHIRGYPIVPKPEIFGLHENADITCDQNETYDMAATVLSLQVGVCVGAGRSWLQALVKTCLSEHAQKPGGW